jgi:hypothetical protein
MIHPGETEGALVGVSPMEKNLGRLFAFVDEKPLRVALVLAAHTAIVSAILSTVFYH